MYKLQAHRIAQRLKHFGQLEILDLGMDDYLHFDIVTDTA